MESTGGEGKDARRRAQASRVGGGIDSTGSLLAVVSKPIECSHVEGTGRITRHPHEYDRFGWLMRWQRAIVLQ